MLDALAAHFAPGIAHTSIARPGVALNIILEEAERFKAELVVIAASGRSRVASDDGEGAEGLTHTHLLPFAQGPAHRDDATHDGHGLLEVFVDDCGHLPTILSSTK